MQLYMIYVLLNALVFFLFFGKKTKGFYRCNEWSYSFHTSGNLLVQLKTLQLVQTIYNAFLYS